MKLATGVVIFILGYALAQHDPILRKADELRYPYTLDYDGVPHQDTWQTPREDKDLGKAARYNPDTDNEYHLFTRSNPTISQPLLPGNAGILATSNYDSSRRTVVIIHGRNANIYADFVVVMVPAFLDSDDVNVIVVDWGPGSVLDDNATYASGHSVANFISWVKNLTGQLAEDFHVVGFSLGAHHAGITARYVEGGVGYVTALDPAGGWENNENILRPDDGLYTEVIWTNTGVVAHLGTLGNVDFYPNGGTNMPGCGTGIIAPACNHFRAYFYMAESIVTGGFTGTECATMEDARIGNCDLPGRLQMGSRHPNIGASGIYYLQTNAAPPFSIY